MKIETESKPYVVLDTNLLISRLLRPLSNVSTVVNFVVDNCNLLVSQATVDELSRILLKMKKKGYLLDDEIVNFMHSYMDVVEWTPILERIKVCRDPKDDMFLELAVNGNSEYIITGDKDLLVLNPFRGINILSPSDFINIMKSLYIE